VPGEIPPEPPARRVPLSPDLVAMAMLVVTIAGVTWIVTPRRAPPAVTVAPVPTLTLADPAAVATETPPSTVDPAPAPLPQPLASVRRLDTTSPWSEPSPTPSLSPAQAFAERARAVAFQDPERARELVEPRVASGRATRDEITLLLSICSNQGDRICVEHCRRLLSAR
jgi:hypothetical protein